MGFGHHQLLPEKEKEPISTGQALAGKQCMQGSQRKSGVPCLQFRGSLDSSNWLMLALGPNLPLYEMENLG